MALVLPPLKFKLKPICCSSSPATSHFQCRPAVILPGLGNNSGDYQRLQLTLKDYGVPTVVAEVSRFDWLRNAAGLVDPNYWRATLRPRPVLDWYFSRMNDAIQKAKEFTPGGKLSLIGHSAGGWLARVYMEEFGSSDISLLLTLGTPHLYIQGARFFGNSNVDVDSTVAIDTDQPISEVATVDNKTISTATSTTFRARIVGQGYKQVCGQADVWGDGVVPEVSAHLEGALNISLDGVYHSPVGSDDALRPWYGSPAVVEKWIHHLLD
ncbi:alpha/beta-Hydrolases superfamily protein [Citrus sinensis]|uniref:Alpha/beta-Hydrolases superfamily protein n=1 Tax=Citrus sinensis TaxID=2711 RepID=A0ACB8LCF1_CITSI|nr:alpha/beta-Hydrolases superfamily protein [Citrus sinensis]